MAFNKSKERYPTLIKSWMKSTAKCLLYYDVALTASEKQIVNMIKSRSIGLSKSRSSAKVLVEILIF